MNTDAIFRENLNSLSEEMVANKILLYSNVDFENVPIRIEDVLVKMGFKLGMVSKFKNDNIIAGIAHVDKEHALKSGDERFFVCKKGLDASEVRYLMALAISYYILESQNSYYVKSIYSHLLSDSDSDKISRIARAIIIPQKSLSTLLLSPLVNKDDDAEKIAKVAKAFLVPMQIARLRMREVGFII